MLSRWMPLPTMALSALSVLLVIACGGGTDDAAPLTAEAANLHSAYASVTGGDTSTALDATVQAAMQLVPGTATTLRAGRKQALSVGTNGLVCAGGGTASMTISGLDGVAELNGRLDAGEIYQIAFIDCRAAGGQAALNGAVTMTVVAASANLASVRLSTTTLSATLPRGVMWFIGGADVQRSIVVNGNATEVTTHIGPASLTVTTEFGDQNSNFTLSDVDLTRVATYNVGSLTTTIYSGSHSGAGDLLGRPMAYSVSSEGGALVSANGVPTQGAWVVTLVQQVIRISLSNAVVIINVDEGKDGSVDRSYSFSIELWGAVEG